MGCKIWKWEFPVHRTGMIKTFLGIFPQCCQLSVGVGSIKKDCCDTRGYTVPASTNVEVCQMMAWGAWFRQWVFFLFFLWWILVHQKHRWEPYFTLGPTGSQISRRWSLLTSKKLPQIYSGDPEINIWGLFPGHRAIHVLQLLCFC